MGQKVRFRASFLKKKFVLYFTKILFEVEVVLEIKVYPEMPRKKNKVVPESIRPVFQGTYLLGEITMMEEIRRVMSGEMCKFFDRMTRHFDRERFEDTEEKDKTNQRLAELQLEVQQPRLATKADV